MRRGFAPAGMREIVHRLVWLLALWAMGVAAVGAAAFLLRRVLL